MAPTVNRPRARTLLLLFALGAVIGTLLDGIHVYGDVLSYPNPAFGRWAWFVPVEFGVLTMCVGLAIPSIERAIAAAGTPRWSNAQRVGEVGLFAVLYYCTVLVDGHGPWPVFLAVVLTGLVAARLLLHRSPGDWFYALVGCVAGVCGEAIMIEAGLFHYANPDFANVPIWLGPLWANAGLMLRRVVAPIVLEPAVAPRAAAMPAVE